MSLTSLLNRRITILGKTSISFSTFIICSGSLAIFAIGSYYFAKKTGFKKNGNSINLIDKAIALKDKGNKFFKASKYKNAIKCYTEAIEMCPEGNASQLAIFYQNRAAAKENEGLVESAIEDCIFALKYYPRYIKALNRRARLYERTSQSKLSLLDATAVVIFEAFQNVDNVMFMEKILSQLSSKEVELLKKSVQKRLPSNGYIRNYFSAFTWDPFSFQSPGIDAYLTSYGTEKMKSPLEEIKDSIVNLDETSPTYVFLTDLCRAINLVMEGDFNRSFGSTNKCLSNDLTQIKESLPNEKASIFICIAKLLKGTFLALSGDSEHSREILDEIIKEGSKLNVIESIMESSILNDSSKNVKISSIPIIHIIKVNALIKKACLVMSANQDITECLTVFREAEKLCPKCPDVYLHRGQIFILLEKFDEALRDFNKVLELEPNSSIALSQQIFASYRKNIRESDFERAFSALEKLKKLVHKFPNCIETRSLNAQLLVERMNYEEADAEFKEVLRLCPDSGIYYGHRAMLHLRWNKDKNFVRQVLLDGLKNDPSCGMLYELLAQIALESADFEAALYYLEEAIKLASSENELNHLLALRIGASAQKEVCAIYGINKEEILAWHQACQERMMTAVQS